MSSRSFLTAATAAVVLCFGASVAQAAGTSALKAPPAAPYKAVSSLVKLPDFIPGMGQLFVDPARCRPGRSWATTMKATW